MRDSVIYLLFFALGVVLAAVGLIPDTLLSGEISKWILYLLLFFVGIQIGTSKNIFRVVRSFGFKIVLIPLATTLGTFLAVALVSFALPNRSVIDCLTVGSGFAYYSLSSILISEYKGAELGTVALLANIVREFLVLIFAPWMVKYFGRLAPINAGGATTMDTTLPIITKFSGADYVVIALFHGMIIDFSVPLWVSFFLSIQ
ncbi:MAG: lysine exporter LysO family protein [Petrimonas sp.]|nr:lysine exporter LysO family protein [Petrimonas sp.]